VLSEAWKVTRAILVGLQYFHTRGFVSRHGAEVPAMWSPGDFSSSIESSRKALDRLAALNEKLYQLKIGTRPE
jgi:hypothetical protein